MVVVSGSMSATSGTTDLLMIATFLRWLGSLMIANCDTSADVPAVVGMQMSGGPGPSTRSTPSETSPAAQPAGSPPSARSPATTRSASSSSSTASSPKPTPPNGPPSRPTSGIGGRWRGSSPAGTHRRGHRTTPAPPAAPSGRCGSGWLTGWACARSVGCRGTRARSGCWRTTFGRSRRSVPRPGRLVVWGGRRVGVRCRSRWC